MMKRTTVMLLVVMFSLCFTIKSSFSAQDDLAFDSCLDALNKDFVVIKNQRWNTAPLPLSIVEAVTPMLYGDKILRWDFHENSDRSKSYIVMGRDPDIDQPEEDPDDFYLVLSRDMKTIMTGVLAANAAQFVKINEKGVAGIIACKEDELSNGLLMWNGRDWYLDAKYYAK